MVSRRHSSDGVATATLSAPIPVTFVMENELLSGNYNHKLLGFVRKLAGWMIKSTGSHNLSGKY